MATKYRYCHPYHTDNKWEEIIWNYPDELQAEMASITQELAEDWADEDAEDSEIQSIVDDIVIELIICG